MSVRLHEAEVLRKCVDCELEATNEMELELFKLDSRGKFGRANLCKECEVNRIQKVKVKLCPSCGRELPLNKFWVDNNLKSGRQSHCIECKNKYREEHIEQYKEYWDEHNAKPEVKQRKNEWQKAFMKNIGVVAITALCDYKDPKCVKCGYNDIRALSIDHIHNDGKKERNTYARTKMYKRIIKNPEKAKKNYQVLCRNCNWIKHLESKEEEDE